MTRRKQGSAGRHSPWATALALAAVVGAALVVFVPAAGAFNNTDGGVVAVDASTGDHINVPIIPTWGASGGTVDAVGAAGSISNVYISDPSAPIPDALPGLPSSFYLDFDRHCAPEEPLPFWTLSFPGDDGNPVSIDDCWAYSLAPIAGNHLLGDGSWGWMFPQAAIGSDGTTQLVFDHWNVSNVAPMGLVFPGQTTPGIPGYCTSGERGLHGIGDFVTGRTPFWDQTGTEYVAYQGYMNIEAGVGQNMHFEADYEPATPDVSPPQININRYLGCETFEQNSTSGSKDGAVGGTYDFFCTDPGYGIVTGPSGVKSCTGKVDGTTSVQNGDPVDTSTRGDHTLVVTAVDNANNTHTRSVTYHVVDDLVPTLNPTFSTSPPFVEGQKGVTLSPGATDGESGLKSSLCPAVDTSTVGNHTAHCTATDNAGNTAGADVTYFVGYGTGSGFLSPPKKSSWKRGQTVPIKLMLTNAQGVHISDTEAAALAKNCKVVVSATGAQTIPAPGCMKYDASTHQFIYNWNLGKSGTGTANVTATISYPSGGPTTVGPLPISIT